MVQFVLIRPGSTDYDEQGRIQGTLDIPLNRHGTDEVQKIIQGVRSLGISAIYACPCRASLETAQAIADSLGIKLKKVDTLQNMDHGLWQGMLVDDVRRKQPKVFRAWQDQPETVCPPEGETLSQAHDRVQVALAKVAKKHKDGTIALVVPEPVASIVHSVLAGVEIAETWKGEPACGTWEVIPAPQSTLSPSKN